MADDKCILDPERDCIGKAAALKLEARIEALEEWQKDSKKFHHDFYDGEEIDDAVGNVRGGVVVIPSSTSGSQKKFQIKVDDSGAITAVEVEA